MKISTQLLLSVRTASPPGWQSPRAVQQPSSLYFPLIHLSLKNNHIYK